jgi:hypothetical protein
MSMTWTSDKESTGPPEFFSTVAPPGEREPWLREMWSYFGENILSLNRAVEWDYVYVEIAADVGRIALYPASSQTADRIEKAGCFVVSRDLQRTYEELERLDEDSFEEELTRETEALAKQILSAASALRGSGISLRADLPVEVWEPDEDEPTATGIV